MRRDVQDGDGGPPAQVSKLRGWLAEGGGGCGRFSIIVGAACMYIRVNLYAHGAVLGVSERPVQRRLKRW